ncbi:methylation-associated defense system restriction endonuclease subunit S MAD5 [Flavobacterium turcicum]|uniref:Restriction endonuclease subunit S n=1 Tax=Flavobacterium turcicum TaxID=2764718 RepID=A0ABR7JF78_9FLAO|nr:restriction endonuclease subunit S [Flavobacterium turcicum]MBC5862824.1 restriction endonuclease subunit S [Flavobacterium turcicum]NHL01556.1 restriction endonuclease subunit S [Flavobacterium turcicum]
MKVLKGKYSWISEGDIRIDSSFHLSDGRVTRKILEQSPLGNNRLGDVTDEIFYGGRAKRIYVENEIVGVPFMGSSDMLKSDFSSLKYISRKITKNIEQSYLKEGWTLVTRSGTVGKTAYVNKNFEEKTASEHIIRVVPCDNIKSGYLYSFLSSKFGYSLMTQGTFGAVIQHIEPDYLAALPIPILKEIIQQQSHNLILEASSLRFEANTMLKSAQRKLKVYTNLNDLKTDAYEYFGNQSNNRKVSAFKRNISEITPISINAFNYSKRIEKLEENVKSGKYLSLAECLNDKKFFSTSSFQRLELDSPTAIKLINQSDIFHIKKQGKMLARKFVKADKLVEYGEVIIAGVGTLGENETFCRAIFANEELEGQLISGEFLRMKTNMKVPPGYLYCWLASDYGFRFIRKTQSGTKLCRPIHKLLELIPVPIIEDKLMNEIDEIVKHAHKKLYDAYNKEMSAIKLIEKEIESWQKS